MMELLMPVDAVVIGTTLLPIFMVHHLQCISPRRVVVVETTLIPILPTMRE
jgi:hypothetical protein